MEKQIKDGRQVASIIGKDPKYGEIYPSWECWVIEWEKKIMNTRTNGRECSQNKYFWQDH